MHQTPPLEAARQTTQMVGQQNALLTIQQAIQSDDNKFKVVFIRARGGMGKTRLLEETLCRAGHPDWNQSEIERWTQSNDFVISDLIDAINVRLHGRDLFIQAIRNGLRHQAGMEFNRYDRSYYELRRLQAGGTDFTYMRKASTETEAKFLEDLLTGSKDKRLVLMVDTVEQLRFVTSEWLLKNELLNPEDLANRTQQWLVKLIKTKALNNITLVLAGRGEEGAPFFENIETAITDMAEEGVVRELVDIRLDHFSPTETREYFLQLAHDWQIRTEEKEPSNDSRSRQIAQQFQSIADEQLERYKVLWLYTGGIPVRLALYAQLIVENRTIPEPLRWPYELACKNAKTDNPDKETPELRKVQWQIEDQFIDLLFRNPTNLRTRILQTLVRAPRGLSSNQLHYVLDGQDESVADWIPDPRRLKEIASTLAGMEDYYLVKRRAHWDEFDAIAEIHSQQASAYRLGLQDEIYRIYAEHMAPHADPVRPDIQTIWDTLDDGEKARYKQNRLDEKEERERLYTQLRDWAELAYQKVHRRKMEQLLRDERELEAGLIPDQTRTFHFRALNTTEVEARLAVQIAMETYEIERMIYALAVNPERNFNRDYVELGTITAQSEKEIFDLWAQSEAWRLMHDEYSLKFVDFQQRAQAVKRGESTLKVLQRAAQQEDVSRWIKRFTTRGEYDRAVKFATEAEKVILNQSRENEKERYVWQSWNHTLNKNERKIWRLYVEIFQGSNLLEIVEETEVAIEELLMLYNNNVTTPALTGLDGNLENGFQADLESGIPAHPALDRLRRLISYAYNVRGYGLITLGRTRAAVTCYGLSLYYLRGDKGMDEHRAVVLNNMSKALSDMGRQSISMCRDGLNLRRQLTAEVPLAYSLNTLALIYDDQGRYEDAQILAAKATAYFRRADNHRGIGMASIQLAEALRHLAIRTDAGEKVLTTSEGLYSTVEELLREALNIFTLGGERVRKILVWIELGSLYRDRMRVVDGMPTHNWRAYQREAIFFLDQAIEEAQHLGIQKLEVDAKVNRAWVTFHMMRYENNFDEDIIVEKIEQEVTLVEQMLPEAYRITETKCPDPFNRELVDLYWILPQLSKLKMLRAQIALTQFAARVDHFKQLYPEDQAQRQQVVHQDARAQQALAKASLNYALGLGYADLYAPGGRLSQNILDDMYSRLKGFNRTELTDFHDRAYELEKTYPTLRGNAVLGPFLHEFFGLPQESHHHVHGSMHEEQQHGN